MPGSASNHDRIVSVLNPQSSASCLGLKCCSVMDVMDLECRIISLLCSQVHCVICILDARIDFCINGHLMLQNVREALVKNYASGFVRHTEDQTAGDIASILVKCDCHIRRRNEVPFFALLTQLGINRPI